MQLGSKASVDTGEKIGWLWRQGGNWRFTSGGVFQQNFMGFAKALMGGGGFSINEFSSL